MKSQGEIEAAVCDGVSRFQHEFIGRGPRDIRAHVIGATVLVRLEDALTPAERQLISPQLPPAGTTVGTEPTASPAALHGNGNGNGNGHPHGTGHGNGHGNGYLHGYDNGNGRALLKQIRAHMVAMGRSKLGEILEAATGTKLISVHHDISTVTGEEVLVFSLSEAPACRPKRKTP